MMRFILVAALLSLVPASRSVATDLPDGAKVVALPGIDLAYPTIPEKDERDVASPFWWWSDECAPQLVEASVELACVRGDMITLFAAGPDRKPLKGVEILWGPEELIRSLPDRYLPSAITGQAGSVTIPVSKPSLARIRAEELGTTWQPVSDSMTLRALPARPLSLSLEGEAPEDLRHAWIEIGPAEETVPIREIAPGGSVEIAGVPRLPSMELSAWSDSHAPVSTSIGSRASSESISMPSGGSLGGVVTDEEGSPVASAAVRIRHLMPGSGRVLERLAHPDEKGEFQVRGLPPGPVEWVVEAPRRVKITGSSEIAGAVSIGTLTLPPARRLTVVVHSIDETPIENASVVLETGAIARTDEKGEATFNSATLSALDASIKAEGFLQQTVRVEAEVSKVVVRLDSGAVVHATPIGADTGEILTPVTLHIRNNGRQSRRTATVGERLEIAGLSGGNVELTISAEGYLPLSTGIVDIDDAAVKDLGVLLFERGFSIRGRVLDEAGQPLDAATVKALDGLDQGPMLAWVMKAWQETTTDPEGLFTLAGLRAGPQFVIIEAPGYVPRAMPGLRIDPGESSTLDLGDVELAQGNQLQVICSPAMACGTGAAILLAGPAFPFLQIQEPITDGVARFPNAPSGSWFVRLSKGAQMIHDEEVVIRDDEEMQTIEIELPASRVDGTVFFGSDAAEGGRVRLVRRTGSSLPLIQMTSRTEAGSLLSSKWTGTSGLAYTAAVDADGRFELESVMSGEYDAVYSSNGGSTAPVPVFIPEVESQTVLLRFDGEEVAGTVIGGDREPVAATVEVLDGGGRHHRGLAGRDGRFRILGLAQGKARMTATGRDGTATAVVDASSRRARELILELEKVDREETVVRVRDARGQPSAGALVFFNQGTRLLSQSTGLDGIARFSAGSSGLFAAFARIGGWTFSGSGGAEVDLLLSPSPGMLEVSSDSPCSLEIRHESGFPIHDALLRLGIAPSSGPSSPLVLYGLPPGRYEVGCRGVIKSTSVVPDELREIGF